MRVEVNTWFHMNNFSLQILIIWQFFFACVGGSRRENEQLLILPKYPYWKKWCATTGKEKITKFANSKTCSRGVATSQNMTNSCEILGATDDSYSFTRANTIKHWPKNFRFPTGSLVWTNRADKFRVFVSIIYLQRHWHAIAISILST